MINIFLWGIQQRFLQRQGTKLMATFPIIPTTKKKKKKTKNRSNHNMQITFNHVLDFCTCKISFVLHILKMWPIMFEFIWSRSQHLWLTVANRHTYQLHLIRRQEWVTLNWSKSFFFFFSFCWHCITSWHCQEMICRLYAFWLNKKNALCVCLSW